jgi:putative transposase
MVSVQARRDQARYAIERGLSHRRACALLKTSRSSLYYCHKMPVKDAPVIEAMKQLSGAYPRFGARRIKVLLQRVGIQIGKERCQRIWAKAGLQVPKKRRRRMKVTRLRPLAPTEMNGVWSYDFVYDACANGQKIKCLTVVDEFTRECLAIDVSGSIRTNRVIEVLSKLILTHGVPRYLRSDNGPEFVSKALLEWVTKESLELALIEPGKPWQNGTNESFNGKFRDECLSAEWFRNRLEAKVVIEDWRVQYNTFRPHSSLNYQTPQEYKKSLGNNGITGVRLYM